MPTVATLPSSTTEPEHTPEPTTAEIEAVDDGLDDDLVDAAFEDLDDDPVIASLQTDRDRLAARGDLDGARAHHHQVREMRGMRALAARRACALEDLDGALSAPAAAEVQA